mmetsp:Transcript_12999/g.36704  ORF Transcript_12999/g.36704 Transcript_12999/m.36704 type:complete len:223 (+) Transcript_12999:110-778(+)
MLTGSADAHQLREILIFRMSSFVHSLTSRAGSPVTPLTSTMQSPLLTALSGWSEFHLARSRPGSMCEIVSPSSSEWSTSMPSLSPSDLSMAMTNSLAFPFALPYMPSDESSESSFLSPADRLGGSTLPGAGSLYGSSGLGASPISPSSLKLPQHLELASPIRPTSARGRPATPVRAASRRARARGKGARARVPPVGDRDQAGGAGRPSRGPRPGRMVQGLQP